MQNKSNQFAESLLPFIVDIDNGVVEKITHSLNKCSTNGGKIVLFGNGGSASIASHLAVDFSKAVGCRSITFSDPSLLTCYSNDYGYDQCYAKCVQHYVDKADICIFISSSGKSPNIINAAKTAKENGNAIITLSGFDQSNELRTLGDTNIWINSSNYNVLETVHQIWLLAVVETMRLSKVED